MKKLAVIVAFVWAALGAVAQENEARGFKITEFSELNVDVAAEIELSQGAPSLKITADKDLFDEIKVTQTGNKVNIEYRSSWSSRKSSKCKIEIAMPTVNEISLSSSVKLVAKTAIQTSKLSIDASGSADIAIATLNANEVEISASGSAKAVLGSSKAVGKLSIAVSGSGSFDTSKMASNQVEISISGSGKAVVNCSQKLDVDVSGSGKVVFYGNPTVESSISGSGKVVSAASLEKKNGQITD